LLEERVVCIVYNDSGNDAGVNNELTRKMRNILSVYLSIVYDRHAFKEQLVCHTIQLFVFSFCGRSCVSSESSFVGYRQYTAIS
jgi:hypothetical protein